MVLCNNCKVMMIPTMSFSHNGNQKYCRSSMDMAIMVALYMNQMANII